jgi:hypothetical protein
LGRITKYTILIKIKKNNKMGYYINENSLGEPLPNIGKANILIMSNDASQILPPKEFPTDYAIICVVDNGYFEAAGYCYSKEEYEEFRSPDGRPKRWLKMDIELAKKLSGYKR